MMCLASGATSNTLPVHFLHIRKTGGTAVIEALQPIADRYGIILHDHVTKLSDVPNGHRVFFFVRHPISRFVSGFYSRLRRGLPRHHYEWSEGEVEAFSHFQTANDLAEALSSGNGERADWANKAMRNISHLKDTYKRWFSGTDELDARMNLIVLLGLQEQLNADFERLKALLHLPQTLLLPVDDVRAHRTPPEFDQRLSCLSVQNLSCWYDEDIRFYDHCVKLRATHGVSPLLKHQT